MRDTDILDQLLRATDALASDMTRFLSEHGLNTTKAHVLWSLRASGPQMQRWLSTELGYSPRHVTTVVDELIALGMVERAAHPDDRRAVLVSLTGAGHDLVASFEADRQTLAQQLFGHLDTVTKTQLVATLTDVADRITAAVEAAAAATAKSPETAAAARPAEAVES